MIARSSTASFEKVKRIGVCIIGGARGKVDAHLHVPFATRPLVDRRCLEREVAGGECLARGEDPRQRDAERDAKRRDAEAASDARTHCGGQRTSLRPIRVRRDRAETLKKRRKKSATPAPRTGPPQTWDPPWNRSRTDDANLLHAPRASPPAGGISGGAASLRSLEEGRSGSRCGGCGAERAKRVEAEQPHRTPLVSGR